jgi:PRC-barrel domain
LEREQRGDRFTEIEDKYAGYEVYDRDGEKIGEVDDLFVDENNQPDYIGVKMGFFGLRSTLIPWQMVRVDDDQRVFEVVADKDRVKDAPNFNDDEEITPEFEREIYSYFGLQPTEAAGEHGRYGAYYGAGDDNLTDEDELRVQRTEEELRVGTREREAGVVRGRRCARAPDYAQPKRGFPWLGRRGLSRPRPRYSLGLARRLAALDLDALGLLGGRCSRDGDLQHTILDAGVDLILVYVLRQLQAPLERAVTALSLTR